MTPGADPRGDPRLGPARPRRRRVPDGHEVEVRRGLAGRRQVHHLQRRRGRPRRVHGRLHHGRRPARRARGHAHRQLRHRRARGLHLRARRVPARRQAPAHGHRGRRGARPPGRRHPRQRLGLPPQDQGGRRRVRLRRGDRAHRLHRGQARHAAHAAAVPRRVAACGASRRTSTTSRRWANVPWIIANGAAAYAAFGNDTCKGTKVFSLAGKIVNGGLVEVPMGSTLRDVIFDVGGGIKDGKKFKAVQIGGPSGGCVPACAPRHAGRLREPRRDRRHRRLRRHGGRRRHHLHGRPRQVLPAVHPERELRQVRALPPRHQAHARDPRAHHRGRGRGGRRRAPREHGA